MRAWLICLFSALAAAQPADPDTEASKRHYDRGRALYEQGRYDDAIGEFETARTLKPLPELLYNIGRTQERREEWKAAADAYEEYLREQPDATDADQLRERIPVLRARPATRPPAAPPAPVVVEPPPQAPMPPPRKTPVRIAALSLLAGTVVLAGIGGVLVGTVNSGFQDLEQTCSLRQCLPSDWAPLQTRANAGYAILALAGAVAITDAVLWYIDHTRPPPKRQARLTPMGVTF